MSGSSWKERIALTILGWGRVFGKSQRREVGDTHAVRGMPGNVWPLFGSKTARLQFCGSSQPTQILLHERKLSYSVRIFV